MLSSKKYTCSLDETSLRKAKEELNENPKERENAIDQFRQWIKSNPKIKCPTDDDFLLFFLRARYFSQLESRILLEKYLKGVSKEGNWFHNLDSSHPDIIKVLEDGIILLLPDRDDDGKTVFLVRLGKMDTSGKYTNDSLLRTFASFIYYVYLMDEMSCTNGTVVVSDWALYSTKQHTAMPSSDRNKLIGIWQGNFPARIKALHFVNIGPMAEIILKVAKLALTDKLQARMKVHGQVLEGLYKDVPMRILPKEYLPDDYTGPHGGTEKQLIDHLIGKFKNQEVRDRIKYLSGSQFGYFEDGAKDNKFGKMKLDKTAPVQASYRKLNVD